MNAERGHIFKKIPSKPIGSKNRIEYFKNLNMRNREQDFQEILAILLNEYAWLSPFTKGGKGMFRAVKFIDFCYAHRLLGYNGKCCQLHGHNGRLEIVIKADHLDNIGISVDFGAIKNTMQGWIEVNFDHKTILQKDDPLAPILQEHGQAITWVEENPTAEYLAKLAFDYAKEAGLPVDEIRFWETLTSYVCYRPTESSL
jgi:6-pyruvoyltetrahydropterin/6-carboxytetrahydropterin synthase